MPANRNSVGHTVVVAVITSLFCSALVTTAAISLKPAQERNELRNQQKNILEVAGLFDASLPIEQQFGDIETRIVELATGRYDDDIDPDSFDSERAAADPLQSVAIPDARDRARIKRVATHSRVYLVRENDSVSLIILPIRGAGLWAPMKGFLALKPDGTTISGLRFHQHGETPGLGDQVEKPRWLNKWEGKLAFDADGVPRIEVIRGLVPRGATSHTPPRAGDPEFQVDGMSGATLTGNSVTAIVRFWLGPDGFGPYLASHWRGET